MPRFSLSRLSTAQRHYMFIASAVGLSAISVLNMFLDHQARTERKALLDASAICLNVKVPPTPAIAACSIVIGRNAKAGWAYANRGLAYASSMQQDLAIADLDTAISIVPNFAWAYAIRAAAYSLKGDREREIADYTKAIALNPADAQSYSNRAVAYLQNGESELAIADTSRAIEINPKLVAAYINRAAAHKKAGDDTRAIEDYRSALALKPGDPTSIDGLKRLGAGS
jgi:tetratricopeptide (TPR) repeat protein